MGGSVREGWWLGWIVPNRFANHLRVSEKRDDNVSCEMSHYEVMNKSLRICQTDTFIFEFIRIWPNNMVHDEVWDGDKSNKRYSCYKVWRGLQNVRKSSEDVTLYCVKMVNKNGMLRIYVWRGTIRKFRGSCCFGYTAENSHHLKAKVT